MAVVSNYHTRAKLVKRISSSEIQKMTRDENQGRVSFAHELMQDIYAMVQPGIPSISPFGYRRKPLPK
jgi:hypothetical protein